MRTRKLGYSDLDLTVIGLGTWAIGGPWTFGWGPQDDQESIAAIHRALDLGVNWIDTAAIYGLGHSEEVVGQAIKGMQHQPLIATKCSIVWDKNREISRCMRKDSIRREVDASLQRLGIDVIDLYQLHWPIPDSEIEEGWTTMAELIKEGKVRYGGVSNFSVAQIKRCQAIHPVASLQPPYSMLERDVERDLLAYCAQNQIGVIAYSPMQRGLLTGAFSHERLSNLAPDDHRRRQPHFIEPQFSINLELVEKLRPIAERNGKTLAQLSIAWVLRRPEMTAAIVGSRRPSQIEEAVGAGDWALSAEDAEEIAQLLAERDTKVAQAS